MIRHNLVRLSLAVTALLLLPAAPALAGGRCEVRAEDISFFSDNAKSVSLGAKLQFNKVLMREKVLVKVTGQRGIAADPARRRAIGSPAPLVRQYQPVGGGQVRVSFDPLALRQRLDAANLPVWPDERPLTLVILPPESPPVPAAPAATAGPATGQPASFRQLLLATAASRGLPVVLAPEPVAGARTGDDPLPDPDGAARAAGADLLLAGRPAPSGGAALLRWTLAMGGDRTEWQGDAAEGAHGLADRLAARYATLASSGRVLRLRITGVDSFDAYGRLQAYLRSMGLIQSADLKEIAAGQLVYEVAVRGDVNQFNDALALRRVLEPTALPAAGDLVYRLVTGALPAGAQDP